MTVAELIAHLQTLPQDLKVQCLSEIQSGWESSVKWKDISRDDLYVIGDFLEIGDK